MDIETEATGVASPLVLVVVAVISVASITATTTPAVRRRRTGRVLKEFIGTFLSVITVSARSSGRLTGIDVIAPRR
jgi:hypothetical protein